MAAHVEGPSALERTVLRVIAWGIGGGVVLVSLALAAAGWEYYQLPDHLRAMRVEDPYLKSSGGLGLALGVCAAMLITFNVLYLVRRNMRADLRFLGSPRAWMIVHVATGLAAPVIALFHSGFTIRTPLGVLTLLFLVVLSLAGLIGRYLYSVVPKGTSGRELQLEQVRGNADRLLENLDAELSTHAEATTGIRALIEQASAPPEGTRWLLSRLASVFTRDLSLRFQLWRLARKLGAGSARKTLIQLTRQALFVRLQTGLYAELNLLLGTWRAMHRALALLTTTLLLGHVSVAVLYNAAGALGDPRVSGVLLTGAVVTALITVGSSYLAILREEEQAASAAALSADKGIPPSLHPLIDLESCMGSGACVDACPEKLLIISEGITHIPANKIGNCVGHGRCKTACPVQAIQLVFGTEKRGVDIPNLRPGYETNVDGIFIAGELGGMGLIRNAMSQGQKAIASVPGALARPGVIDSSDDPQVVDVVIVGGGPAGLSSALACIDKKLSYTLLEQDTVGGSVAHFPRRKLIFTEQTALPIVGKVGRSEMRKEELIAEFERIIAEAGIEVREGHRVVGISGSVGRFAVECELSGGERRTYLGRSVALCIGRRGTPRRLEVPGESQEHVVYRLVDPEQFRHRRVLCVGGGDSAVEAAVALSKVAGCEVHLSYRKTAVTRAKSKNRERMERAVAKGRLHLQLGTQVKSIGADHVILTRDGAEERLGIDDVIVNVGGVLPTAFLTSLGVEIEHKRGTA